MREKGIFSFAGNFEVAKTAPLDSKMLVPSYADLTKAETWTDSKGAVWIYKGMIVACQDAPGKLFQLSSLDYTKTNSWSEISGTEQQIANHISDTKTNPHKVTKAQVGLGNVDNTSDLDKPISKQTQDAIDAINKGSDSLNKELSSKIEKEITDRTAADTALQTKINDEAKARSSADTSLQNSKVDKTVTVNGHALSANITVTKGDVGLGNVTNDAQVKRTEMGVASGVATLDTTGKIPSSQLPSYVDDVLEYANKAAFPKTGEEGKIYVAKDTNLTYRWSGTGYVEISPSLALGETDSTAFPGNRGKALETSLKTHIDNKTNPHGVTKDQVGLDKVDNTSDLEKPISAKQQAALDTKVTKVAGKQLSTEDFTTSYKNRVDNLAGFGSISHIMDDSAFKKSDTDVKLIFECITADTAPTNKAHHEVSIGAANSTTAGVMSAADKKKLDGIANGANAYSLPVASSTVLGGVKVGSGLAMNNGILSATGGGTADSVAWSGITGKPSIFPADFSAKYAPNDLNTLNTIESQGYYYAPGQNSTKNKPTYVDAFNLQVLRDGGGALRQVLWGQNTNKMYVRSFWNNTWSAWIDCMDYNTLTNKPAIPSVGNGTVTITQAGQTKGSFTLNQSGNATIALSDTNTTYAVATQSANGLMSAADKKSLDGMDAKINAKLDASTAFRTVTGTSVKGSGDIVPSRIADLGKKTVAASGGTTGNPHDGMAMNSGLFVHQSYQDPNCPSAYGNMLNIAGTGDSQLFCGWSGDNSTGRLYYRSHRDYSPSTWGPWKQIMYVDDLNVLTDAEIDEICK